MERVWSLSFFKQFGFVLVVGLSVESLLTQSAISGFIPPAAVFILHSLLISCSYILLWRKANAIEIRIACIFGLIWCGTNIVISTLVFFPSVDRLTLLHILDLLAGMSLFCSLSTLSIFLLPLRRWDKFATVSLLGMMPFLVLIVFFVTLHDEPLYTQNTEFILFYESTIILYIISILLWWSRPHLWKSVLTPTLLIGIGLILQTSLTLPITNALDVNIFYTQVSALAIALALLYIARWITLQSLTKL